jgi:hypothetical protein
VRGGAGEGGFDRKSEDVTKCIMYLKTVKLFTELSKLVHDYETLE